MRVFICTALSTALVATATAAKCQDLSPFMEDRTDATECLTMAIAYEAGYESIEGQRAVAEVILNRFKSPSFPKTICGVVFAGSTRRTGCQFTFTCDGSLYRRRLPPHIFQAARVVASEALAGQAPSMVAGATHYHADYVHPYWAPSLTRVTKIGTHIFYHASGAGIAGTAATVPDIPRDFLASPAGSLKTSPAGQTFRPWGLALPPASHDPQ